MRPKHGPTRERKKPSLSPSKRAIHKSLARLLLPSSSFSLGDLLAPAAGVKNGNDDINKSFSYSPPTLPFGALFLLDRCLRCLPWRACLLLLRFRRKQHGFSHKKKKGKEVGIDGRTKTDVGRKGPSISFLLRFFSPPPPVIAFISAVVSIL